jgi:hypothetical protein
MALLFLDGFDHIGTFGSSLPVAKWASSSGSNVEPSTTVARTGPCALRIGHGGNTIISRAFPASGGAVVGVALQMSAVASSAGDLIQIREGTTVHVAVGLTTAGLLTVKRGSTVLATGTTALAINSWYYLELKTVIHDTTGTYELRIDGVPELGPTTGVDTNNAGATGQWDRLCLLSYSGSGYNYYDDVYVCDTSGATQNTFLGVCKIETLLPQTGNGTNVGLTPSTPTDHGALVDENPPNTTDYNSSATVGAKDTYHYPSLALTGSILGIQTNLYVAKSDAAARTVCAVVRAGGTDYDGANVAPLTTFSYVTEVRALNPNTGLAWTAADITALEAGMKVTA